MVRDGSTQLELAWDYLAPIPVVSHLNLEYTDLNDLMQWLF